MIPVTNPLIFSCSFSQASRSAFLEICTRATVIGLETQVVTATQGRYIMSFLYCTYWPAQLSRVIRLIRKSLKCVTWAAHSCPACLDSLSQHIHDGADLDSASVYSCILVLAYHRQTQIGTVSAILCVAVGQAHSKRGEAKAYDFFHAFW